MTNYISKKVVVIITIFLVVVMAASFSSRLIPVVPVANPTTGCSLTTAEFNSWFNSGSVTLNGKVKPFVSESFPRQHPEPPNCVFFKWSEQTFLWLTSPAAFETLSGPITNRVFNSPAFYDVSPPDEDGNRSFIPHEPGKIKVVSFRDAQRGANKLPVIFEKKTGRLLEIEETPVSPKGLPLISNKAGVQTEVANITLDDGGKPVFMDKSGKVIQNPKPIIQKRPDVKSIVHKYVIGRTSIFLDAFGKNIEVEEGQADGGVLMSQNNSLVYYSITVNQQYAFFHSGDRNGDIDNFASNWFGRSPDKVAAYAAIHGKTIIYPEVYPMEIKCSWVEASSLPDASQYIQMKATIPTYNKSAQQWIPNGQKTVDLALVGMHIVGAVEWFPDMLWASFEHVNNTPNATYFYNSTSNPPIRNANTPPIRKASPPVTSSVFETVPQNTSGSWTFCADGSTGPFNVSRMHTQGNRIVANSGSTIGPSNIIRWKPWGSGNSIINTELKTLNNSVMNMLKDGDLRKNYIQIGTTWKVSVKVAPGEYTSEDRGSTKLANSTMETYLQGTSNSITTGTTCFSCHVRGVSDWGGPDNPDFKAYSHIYYSLKPFFQKLNLVK